jgi:hypothetical protein
MSDALLSARNLTHALRRPAAVNEVRRASGASASMPSSQRRRKSTLTNLLSGDIAPTGQRHSPGAR